MSERRFARIYYDDLANDHADVWQDDAMLANFVRLLAAAEKAWPSRPEVPRSCKARAVDRLAEAGIVTLRDHHTCDVKGFAADREMRAQSGRKGAAMRWQSDGNAKPNQTNTEQTNPSARARATDPADAYWQLTGKYPTDKVLGWVDDLAAKYGGESVIRCLVAAHTADRSTSTLLGRVQDILRSEARELDRRERQDEQRRLAEKRAVPRQEEPWKAEYRRMLEERYGEDAA